MGKVQDAQPRPPEFAVVGIGASAGGITALQSLFKALPPQPDLALVVVQHLSPEHPSQLATLLRGWAALPVREAAGGMKLERGGVFVAPPGRALALQGGVFTIEPIDRVGSRTGVDVIDFFFESLAANCGRRAIAVLLSGTGADGAAGAARIKQAGGTVLVQDPATAMHDGMPRAAIAHGAADRVLSLGALARELTACAAPDYVRSGSAASWVDDVTKALNGVIELVRTRVGFDLTGYKTTPLLWRIERRMELRRVSLFRDYEALLHDDPAELEALIRSIPIHVTEFFRDAGIWQRLQREVVPRLFDEARDGPIRAWTLACASGEEAYSLAMLLAEQADALGQPADFQVFATDAAAEIVARAGRGIFKAAALTGLSSERQQRFFYAADGAFRVKRSLREKMVFAPQDVLADPPFTNLDLVTCRNLLIYLEPDAAGRVVYLLHSALRLGGYLLLSKGESFSPKQRGFEELAHGASIYRKIGPATRVDFVFPKRPLRLRTPRSSRSAVEAHVHTTAAETHDVAAVLVDEHFQIIRLYGDTAPFLRLKPGEPTLNLLRLVTPGIGAQLERAAQQVLAQQSALTVNGLADPATGELTLSVQVTPIEAPQEGGAKILVSFLGSQSAGNGGRAESFSHGVPRPEEAVDWSEALRRSHEELEASREELQALNEELRASNDQLNLANDDLAAANAQLRSKLEELATQSNVLSSGAVMTLFLDQELRVRWFTPAVGELFPLVPSDVGRRITDFVQRFVDEDFLGDVHAVMQQNEPRDAEVHNVEGNWFLRRIRPYRAESPTAAGVAVTFTDISERKRAEKILRESEEALAADLADTTLLRDLADRLVTEESVGRIYEEILSAAISITRSDAGTVQAYDPETQSLELLVTRNFARKMTDHFRHVDAGSHTACGLALRSGRRTFVDFDDAGTDEACMMHVEAGYRSAQATPLLSRAGTPLGMLNTHWKAAGHRPTDRQLRFLDLLARQAADLIEQRQAQRRLRESEEWFRGFVEKSADVLWIADITGKHLEYLSPAFERTFGEPPDRAVADRGRIRELIHPEDRADYDTAISRSRLGETALIHYRVVRPADGRTVHLRDTAFPVRGPSGAIRQIAGVVQDVSDMVTVATALKEEQDRFHTLAQGVPQLVWRAGATGLWTWASPRWCDYTGQAEAASHGWGWLEAVHPEDRATVRQAWGTAEGQGRLELRCRVRCAANGSWRWHATRAVPVRRASLGPGEPEGSTGEWLGVSTDVDDQVRRAKARGARRRAGGRGDDPHVGA